jgi:hypothetical protein
LALMMALIALYGGPVMLLASGGSTRLRATLDGFVLALVSGICLLHLGPHTLAHGGLVALAGIAFGLALPAWLHRADHDSVWIGTALTLLGFHALLDGAALGMLHADLTTAAGAAIVAHRLPVGLAISLRSPTPAIAGGVLTGLVAMTIAGFAMGSGLGHGLPEAAHALLEGTIVGGLLHVVVAHEIPVEAPRFVPLERPHSMLLAPRLHHGHSHGHHHHTGGFSAPADRKAGAAGAIAGIALLAALASLADDTPALAHLEATGRAFVALSLTSAPALLAGFALAGLVSGFLDPARASWLGGGSPPSQALRGVTFGLPLPVCSCGVVPMYQSLVQRGVPVTAGLAFLVATPELGLDAVLLSFPLLGAPITMARILAAFAVAILVAVLVGRHTPKTQIPLDDPDLSDARPMAERLQAGLRFGLVDLVDHTLPWIVVGLLLAALAEPLLDHGFLATLPAILQVPIAAVIGIPLYVCASGATPMAAVAVHKGLSAGAALTFLLAGPATNITTFGVLSALHGKGVALRFGLVLTVAAIAMGWSVDLLGLAVPDMAHPGETHDHNFAWVGTASAGALLLLGSASLWRQGARGVVNQVLNPIHAH